MTIKRKILETSSRAWDGAVFMSPLIISLLVVWAIYTAIAETGEQTRACIRAEFNVCVGSSGAPDKDTVQACRLAADRLCGVGRPQ